MFERLEATRSLTANQWRIVAAAILGDMLEFFDYFLIGFVLAFIVGPWQLSFGQSAIILLSSGIGAILGAAEWGRLADRIGRRAVFIGTVLNFSLATGVLALTPDHGWIFLTFFRFFVGFGVGGLYCVDLPLVQEFVPASRRGFVGGLVTAFIPIGVMVGSILGAFLAPVIGWRGLFACGLVPALLTLLIRAWVPESPRWLVRMGRPEEARRSLAWALQVPAESLPLPQIDEATTQPTAWTDLFRYVAPGRRGEGVGGAMVARAAAFSFETHHVARIDLGVAAENAGAIACYRRQGFDHVGTWPQAIRMGRQTIDVCWMTLIRTDWARSLAADAASG